MKSYLKFLSRNALYTAIEAVGLAVAIGIPISILLSGRLLERWPDRISNYWWIFVVSALFVFLISALAILWQTIKAAKTNPAAELKKE
jgi:MFS family permease